jgi:hypothetical protein
MRSVAPLSKPAATAWLDENVLDRTQLSHLESLLDTRHVRARRGRSETVAMGKISQGGGIHMNAFPSRYQKLYLGHWNKPFSQPFQPCLGELGCSQGCDSMDYYGGLQHLMRWQTGSVLVDAVNRSSHTCDFPALARLPVCFLLKAASSLVYIACIPYFLSLQDPCLPINNNT